MDLLLKPERVELTGFTVAVLLPLMAGLELLRTTTEDTRVELFVRYVVVLPKGLVAETGVVTVVGGTLPGLKVRDSVNEAEELARAVDVTVKVLMEVMLADDIASDGSECPVDDRL